MNIDDKKLFPWNEDVSNRRHRAHPRQHLGKSCIQQPWLFMLILVLFPRAATPWGKTGHEIIGNIAWYRLSNETRDAVKSILWRDNDDGSYGDDTTAGSPLAQVADWADRVRYTKYYHWSAPLHFIDVEDEEVEGECACIDENEETDCHFDYERDCVDDFCVAGAIWNYTKRLDDDVAGAQFATTKDRGDTASSTGRKRNLRRRGPQHWSHHDAKPSMTGASSRESLEFLTHFVGDIHQPLHCSRKSDRGGNIFHVEFNVSIGHRGREEYHGKHKGWNLHSVWDDGMIERKMDELDVDRSGYETYLIHMMKDFEEDGKIDEWLACGDGGQLDCAKAWGEESLMDALIWAYRNTNGREVHDGSKLHARYYTSRIRVVHRRLIAAGVRLAETLETVFTDMSSS